MGDRRSALGGSAAGCAVATSVRIDNGQTTAAILKCMRGTKFSMGQLQRILCAQVFFLSADKPVFLSFAQAGALRQHQISDNAPIPTYDTGCY
jgi:hypothetical protein